MFPSNQSPLLPDPFYQNHRERPQQEPENSVKEKSQIDRKQHQDRMNSQRLSDQPGFQQFSCQIRYHKEEKMPQRTEVTALQQQDNCPWNQYRSATTAMMITCAFRYLPPARQIWRPTACTR